MRAACKRLLWRVKQTFLAEKEFSHVQLRCVQVAWDTGPVHTASRSHCQSTQARADLLHQESVRTLHVKIWKARVYMHVLSGTVLLPMWIWIL